MGGGRGPSVPHRTALSTLRDKTHRPFPSVCDGTIRRNHASKLRTRHYPAHITVVRRGDPGDSMFFISNGEVEVRLPRRAVKIKQGGFFGEMALLDRGPRSAT